MEQRETKSRLGKTIISELPLILLILGSFAAGALLYDLLPEQMPSHWNISGEIDG
ncbi:MAG: DUF1648 domain-containing protein, partial [Desulfotomaculaceae bacterium]|nr:DUF1648 domain-containing protein [Desulfotomaculaceae bacterium]